MPNTFTQFLLQNELASVAELEEASQATVLYGGRLGTALIELGLLAPEQLDQALAQYHALPEIPREWFTRPDAGARAALHVDLIKRHRAFPLFFEKRSLHVGMVDPRDELVLDNLAFASGCVIVAYALAEFRFVELMHRVFAVAPSARFRTLLDEGNRARVLRGREEQRRRVAAEREKKAEMLEVGPLAADLEAGSLEAFFVAETSAPLPALRSASAVSPALAAIAAAPPPLAAAAAPQLAAAEPAPEIDEEPILLDRRAPRPSLEELERTIAESDDRGRVIDAALELASRFAEVAALFVIRDGMAAGLAAKRYGEPLDIDATLVPIAADSVLARCYASRETQQALPASPLDKLLAKALRSGENAEFAVHAVAIGERVVNLLVAQPKAGALSATGSAALGAIAPQIAAGYERLIRKQKQKAQAPAEPAAPALGEPTADARKAAIGALPLQKRVVKVPAKPSVLAKSKD